MLSIKKNNNCLYLSNEVLKIINTEKICDSKYHNEIIESIYK